jgi:hypothetical protein
MWFPLAITKLVKVIALDHVARRAEQQITISPLPKNLARDAHTLDDQAFLGAATIQVVNLENSLVGVIPAMGALTAHELYYLVVETFPILTLLLSVVFLLTGSATIVLSALGPLPRTLSADTAQVSHFGTSMGGISPRPTPT